MRKDITTSDIPEDWSLTGATTRFGNAIPVYDDAFGDLYIHRDSMGISGIVRSQSWEDAYGICEDEFFPDCDLTEDELLDEYGEKVEYKRRVDSEGNFAGWETVCTPCRTMEAVMDHPCFHEAYGFRGSLGEGKENILYAKDLNGDSLEPLTDRLIQDLEITLTIED